MSDCDRSRGFTITEVLAALAVSMLVAGLSYELYDSAQRGYTQWTRNLKYDVDNHIVRSQMLTDMHREVFVRSFGGRRCTMIGVYHDTTVYVYRDSQWERSDDVLHLAESTTDLPRSDGRTSQVVDDFCDRLSRLGRRPR
jgi:hypothetical protein